MALLSPRRRYYCAIAVSLWVESNSDAVPAPTEKPSLEDIVKDALKAADMSPTELGRRMGFSNGFQGYHRIFVKQTTAFTPKRQRQAEDILGLPRGHFDNPSETERRRRLVRQAFEQFLETDIAKELEELDPELIRTLKDIPFYGPRVPTRDLYIMVAAAMSGKGTVREIAEAAELNARMAEIAPPEAKPNRRPGLRKRE